MGTRRQLTTSEADEACLRYLAGENTYSLGAAFNVAGETIRKLLIRRGIPRRPKTETARRHMLNEEAFTCLTETSAYWLGLLFTDGCLEYPLSGSPRISLLLKRSDEPHLEKLKSFLGASNPIYRGQPSTNRGGEGNSCLRITSTKVADSLVAYGMSKGNSLSHRARSDVANSRDFWRGAVDGDGGVGIQVVNGGSRKRPYIDLCGGEIIIRQFMDYIHAANIQTKASPARIGKIYRIAFSANKAIALTTLLYANAPVALQRKQRTANSIISGSY